MPKFVCKCGAVINLSTWGGRFRENVYLRETVFKSDRFDG